MFVFLLYVNNVCVIRINVSVFLVPGKVLHKMYYDNDDDYDYYFCLYPAGISASGRSAARRAVWACSIGRCCAGRSTPTAHSTCTPAAAGTWSGPRPPAPASSRSAVSGRSAPSGVPWVTAVSQSTAPLFVLLLQILFTSHMPLQYCTS